MSVRMRHTRSHTGNRRSHHALEEARLSTCECGAVHERHKVCHACGKYRGRQVIDIVARTERANARRKRKEEEMRSMGAPQKGGNEKDEALESGKKE